MNLTTKKIIVLLILVVLISLGLKLYYIDFSLPYNSDNLGFILRGFSHLSGDFDQLSDKGIGWSLFIFPLTVNLVFFTAGLGRFWLGGFYGNRKLL